MCDRFHTEAVYGAARGRVGSGFCLSRRPIFGAEDTASDAPNGLDRPYRAAASLQRLWAVQTIAHSAWTLARPRIRNWRKPRACLIWPKTGSTVTLRR